MGCSEFDFQQNTCTQVNIGFDFLKTLTYTDILGTAIDLTGFTLAGDIKDELGGSSIILLPEVGDNDTTGLYIPDRTLGVINLQIKEADTAITAAAYPYEITITDSNTDVTVFMQGTIQFYNRGF